MLIEEASHDLHAGRIVTFPVRATVSGPAPMNSPQPGGEPANACGGGIETLLDGGGSALDQRRKRLPWLNTGSQNGHGLAVRSAPPLDSSGIAPILWMMPGSHCLGFRVDHAGGNAPLGDHGGSCLTALWVG